MIEELKAGVRARGQIAANVVRGWYYALMLDPVGALLVALAVVFGLGYIVTMIVPVAQSFLPAESP